MSGGTCLAASGVHRSWLACAIFIVVSLPLRAAPLERWNEVFIEAVQAESTPPGLAARNLAIFHLAIDEAVAATSDDAAIAGAVDGAASRVGRRLYPGRSAAFSELLETGKSSGGGVDDVVRDQRFRAGVIADRVLEGRKDDGASLSVHYVPKAGDGQWRRPPSNRPPELPQWPGVRPFVIQRASQFRPAAPPEASSESFLKALEEVRQLGSRDSLYRTAEQTETAKFWADFTYTSSPPGHWNEIARSAMEPLGLDTRERSRVFLIMNLALADAGIAAFDCKYRWNYWRPVTAMKAKSIQSEGWEPLLPTPPHPEYVSAHAAFSGAAATVLGGLLAVGEREIGFEVTSVDVPDVTRRYTSFDACAEEICLSRLYGGIHYRFSNDTGKALGQRIGEAVLRAYAEEPGDGEGEERATSTASGQEG